MPLLALLPGVRLCGSVVSGRRGLVRPARGQHAAYLPGAGLAGLREPVCKTGAAQAEFGFDSRPRLSMPCGQGDKAAAS